MNDKKTPDSIEKKTLEDFKRFMKKNKEKKVDIEITISDSNTHKKTFFETIMMIVDSINNVVEDILRDNKKSKWLSLFLAIIFFASVNGDSLGTYTERTVENVAVEIRNFDSSTLDVTGIPSTVTVKMAGNIVNLQSTIYKGEYVAYVDLQDYTVGDYTIDIKVDGLPSGISHTVNTPLINIRVSERESRTFALGYRFINENLKEAQYVLEPPILSRGEVTVNAGLETLEKINTIECLIDVKGVSDSFTQKATIRAYDIDNNELNVIVDPATVDVTVNVTSYSKQIPIRFSRAGNADSRYGVASLTSDPSSITIYGTRAALSEIEYINASIDFTDIDESKTIYGVVLETPSGVNSMSTERVTVNVVLENRIYKPNHAINISVINNDKNYNVSYNNTTTVTVSGAESRVASLSETTVSGVINVANLGPGEYTVPLVIKNQDSLLDVELVGDGMINISISETQ